MAGIAWVRDDALRYGCRTARAWRRRRVRLAVAVVLLLSVFSARPRGWGAEGLPLQGSSPPKTAAANESGLRWHHSLSRDRRLEQRLKTAERLLQSDDLRAALVQLQAVLDSEDDAFIRPDDGSTPSGARSRAEGILIRLPRSALQVYEALYGGEASRALAESVKQDDRRGVEAVGNRFLCTAAGCEAWRRLAQSWEDRGNPELAAGCWKKLLGVPAHRRALSPVQALQGARVLIASGETGLARELLEAIGTQEVVVAGKVTRASEWLVRIGAGAEHDSAPRMTFGQPAHRNGVAAGSPPVLSRPQWTLALADAEARHLQPLLSAWKGYQQQNGQPLGTVHEPVLLSDRMVVRDFQGLRCIRLRDGELLWRYTAVSSLAQDIPPSNAAPVDGNPDPGNLMRLWVGNGVLGRLSTDGQRVFAIDGLESRWNQNAANTPADGRDPLSQNRRYCRLVALSCGDGPDRERAPEWTAGGAPDGADSDRPLAGYFFLGPPLALGGRLYAVVETGGQLFAACLRGETGAVEWLQPLCGVAVPIQNDHQRYYLPATPSYSGGVLVCPTQAGLLMALDPLSGRLLWASSYDDADQLQLLGAWPNSLRHLYGHRGYCNVPLIHAGRVVYLPPHSDHVHCFDLATGDILWKVRRQDLEQAIEYVATLTDQSVLIVGRLRCRAVALATGAELWSTALTSSPAGKGLRQGGQYLIPLSEGTLVRIDVATGEKLGFTLPQATARPGSLLAVREQVLSIGVDEISAYPQAAPLLARLEAAPHEPESTESELLRAEIELTVGQTSAARSRLKQLVAAGSSEDGVYPAFRRAGSAGELTLRKVDDVPRALASPSGEISEGRPVITPAGVSPTPAGDGPTRARELLRELLFHELVRAPDDRDTSADLQGLLSTAEQAGRFLVHRAAADDVRNSPELTVDLVRQVLDLDLKAPLSLDSDPARQISAEAWAREFLADRHADWSTAEIAHLTDALARDTHNAGQFESLARMRQWTAVVRDQPCAGHARLQLARRLIDQGETQEAELNLLACRESDDVLAAAEATAVLADLWNDRGVFHSAGQMLYDLATRYADVPLGDESTGASYVARYPRDRLAWHAYIRLTAPEWTGRRVKITEQRWVNERLQSTYNGNGVQFLPTPRSVGFDLFDKGRGAGGQLTIVDRNSGVEYPELVRVPARYFYPSSQQCFMGHLLPLGSLGVAHGVSLLERKLMWSTTPRGLQNRGDLVRVGPAGPNFCTFQCRQHLFALHPANGRVMWHRTDVEGLTGLMIDPATGLFGDEQVLVLFAGDRTNYTVFRTTTGEELRRGKLEIDRRHTRRAFGRRLVHFAQVQGQKRLRIWDPLDDSCVIDEPAERLADISLMAGVAPGTKAFQFVHHRDEIAWVTTEHHVRVVDVATGEVRLDRELEPQLVENLGMLRVFADASRYYVNLQRMPQPGDAPPQNSFITSDATLPLVHVQGELCAIDRASQSLLWTRPMANRSVLQVPEFQLPVLVTMCRVRQASQLFMQVEVFDAATGELLGSREGLLPDRLLQVTYERSPGLIELRGARTEVGLQFEASADAVSTASPAGR